MTLIIGMVNNGKVYVGGDSAGVSRLDVRIRKDSKVFKKGEFVIGCTTSFRMIQLIRFSFNPPKKYDDIDIYEYMCTGFVDALRDCFKKGGFSKINNGEESGGEFIVGWRDRLFKIYSDFQVSEEEGEYIACGCGEHYALGALDAIDRSLPIEDKILTALKIGEYRTAGVRSPFIIENT